LRYHQNFAVDTWPSWAVRTPEKAP